MNKIATLSIILILLSAVESFSQTPNESEINTDYVGSMSDPYMKPSLANSSNTNLGSIYQPNLFNGSANIIIPFYKYPTECGDLGVTINYNTQGIKVDEVASPVGLHWQLNAGGGIIRIIKDAPDELNNYRPASLPNDSPSDSIYVKGKWASILGSNTPAETTPSLEESRRSYYDSEFDDFIVSVGTLHFTFNIGTGRFVFTNPERRIKIDLLVNGTQVTTLPYTYTDGTVLNLGFHITDENGTQYWFEKDFVDNWDYWDGKNYFSEPLIEASYIKTWRIKKIMFSNGQTINYSYEDVDILYVPTTNFTSLEEGSYPPIIRGNGSFLSATPQSMSRIKTIAYPNGNNVDFIYDNNISRCDVEDHRLKEIRVSSGSNCVRYVMQQDYLCSRIGTNNTPEEVPLVADANSCKNIYNMNSYLGDTWYYMRYLRMRLNGIRVTSCDSSYDEPYFKFEYDTLRLPPRLSSAQDFYGYYNGAAVVDSVNSGQLTIPLHTPLNNPAQLNYGVVRNDFFPYTNAGNLDVVQNAYGGYIGFEYDRHVLNNEIPNLPTSDPVFFGWAANDGVRLKKIVQKDYLYNTSSYSKETDFSYSGGQMFLTGGYFDIPHTANVNGTTASWYFTGVYISPHQFINGANHGYSSVTTVTKGLGGATLGSRVVTFTNFSDSTSNNNPRLTMVGDNVNYYQLPFADRQYIRDWEIGLPLTITNYDQNGRITDQTINHYTFSLDTSSTVNKVVNTKIMRGLKAENVSDTGEWYNRYRVIDSAKYRPYTGSALLDRQIRRKYVSNTTFMADTISLVYDDRENLTSTTTKNSQGQQITVNNVYNYNISGPGIGGSAGTPLYDMTSAGIEKVVSTERWKGVGRYNIQSHPNDLLLDASIFKYSYNNGILLEKGLYNKFSSKSITYLSYVGSSTSGILPANFAPVKNLYDNNSIPASFKESSLVTTTDDNHNPGEIKVGGVDKYKTTLWDDHNRVIAQVDNAKANEIAFTSFENGQLTGTTQYSTQSEGNFIWTAIDTMTGNAVTGRKYFKLTGAQSLMCNINTPKKYIVTLWCKNGTPTISGAGFSSVTLTNTYTSSDGWKFYIGQFTPTSGGLVSFGASSQIYIDEVRIFPADALMQSWTYAPMFGKCSYTDPKGRITYYEYDKLGRLSIIRDQEKNIVSKTDYSITH